MCITVLGDDHNDDRDNNVDEVENNANINGSLDESWGCYCCGWSKNSIHYYHIESNRTKEKIVGQLNLNQIKLKICLWFFFKILSWLN